MGDLNRDGYNDPTADCAIANADRQKREEEYEINALLEHFSSISKRFGRRRLLVIVRSAWKNFLKN